MTPERNPVIDFRHQLGQTVELQPLDFRIAPDDSLATYIRHRLPNAKTTAERDAEILNNEHAIRRWMEGV